MRPPYEQSEPHIVEGDHSQLWLRQRRLQVRSKQNSAVDDGTCSCRSPESQAPQSIDSAELLAGRREVQIVHAGETYRLLVTRNNKLILQK